MIKDSIMEKLELKHIVGYLPYRLKCLTTINIEGNPVIEEMTLDYLKDMIEYPIGEKPILRPLSDLTKEIEVNGEKFVPYDKLIRNDVIWILAFNITDVTYSTVKKLYEWHFDIHGLIQKGLAIDINTLSYD